MGTIALNWLVAELRICVPRSNSGMRCRFISYAQVQQLCWILARKILLNGYRPDRIIGIARGGWIPARLLSDLLGIFQLSSIRIEHWGVAQRRAKPELLEGIPLELHGQNLLVLDDIADTGLTLELAKQYLRERGAQVRTGVLHLKSGSKHRPDYHAKLIKRWVWVIYPWHLQEDLTRFIPELMGSSKFRRSQLQQRLAMEYGLELDSTSLKSALSGLALRGVLLRWGSYWKWVGSRS